MHELEFFSMFFIVPFCSFLFYSAIFTRQGLFFIVLFGLFAKKPVSSGKPNGLSPGVGPGGRTGKRSAVGDIASAMQFLPTAMRKKLRCPAPLINEATRRLVQKR